MKTIAISVRDKVAVTMDETQYICGNSDFIVKFDFDAEWDEFDVKTVRFSKDNRKYIDVVLQGNECPVPIIYNTNKIMVGVFAGDLHTSTPAIIPAQKSILCRDGSPEAPSEDVYAQIMEQIKGFLKEETDPTVPAWAKQPQKPSYNKSEVGLGNVDNVKQYSADNPPPYPVTSVNGKTGEVKLGAADVGARPDTWMPTATEVGALPAGTKIPAKTSDITNDSGFITKAVSDLANYYLKSETLTKAEINALVSTIPKFSIQVVSALPTSEISTTTVYLVAEDSADGNLYTEYIYVDGWEILGSQRVDLTGYATEVFVKDYAQPKGDYALKTEIPNVPVKSVNGKTGEVKLSANDVGADPSGTAATHNTDTNAHADIRKQISQLFSAKADVITPQQFGAEADGVTDDTAAINAAIEAAGDGGTVFFPEGTYLVSSSMDSGLAESERYIAVKVYEKQNMTLKLSPGAHIKHKAFTKDELISAGTTRYYVIGIIKSSNIQVIGGKIEGEAAEHTYHTYQDDGTYSRTHGYGINIYSSNDVTVRDCEIFNCYGDSIHVSIMSGSEKSKNATIENCKIHDSIRLGIGVCGADNLIIRDCEIYDIAGASPQSGIDFEPDYVSNINLDCIVENCRIYDCAAYAIINTKANKGTKIRNCQLYGKIISTEDDTYPVEYTNCDILWYQSSNGHRNILHNCRMASCSMYELGDDFYDCIFDPDLFNHAVDGYGATVTSLIEAGPNVTEESLARFYRCEFVANNSGGYASNFYLWRNNGTIGSVLLDGCRFMLGLHAHQGVRIATLADIDIARCIFTTAETAYPKQFIELNAPGLLRLKDNVIDIRALTSYSGYSSLVRLYTKNTHIEGNQILAATKVCTYPISQTFVGDAGEMYVLRNYMPMWDTLGSLASATATKFLSAGNIIASTQSEVVFTAEDKAKLDGIGDELLNAGFITEEDAKGYTDLKVTELAAQGVQQTPLFANNIEECTDTAKVYVLPDGNIYGYILTVTEGGLAYTNLLPSATDASGNVYNGTGFKLGVRLSGSAGTETSATSETFGTSGYIPVSIGDTVRIENYYAPTGIASYMISYAATDKTKLIHQTFTAYASQDKWVSGSWWTVKDGVTTVEITEALFGATTGFIRFSGAITAETIVTVNQEIDDTPIQIKDYAWGSTGHAFVPADYEDRILALEAKIAELEGGE